MATYYVDLDYSRYLEEASDALRGDGTSGNAWSWTSMCNNVKSEVVSGTDIVKIKGQYNAVTDCYVVDSFPYKNITFENWIEDEPWRIEFITSAGYSFESVTFPLGSIIKNGIISHFNLIFSLSYCCTYINVIVFNNLLIGITYCNLYGCSLYCSEINMIYDADISLYDCTFFVKGEIWTQRGRYTSAYNCLFSVSGIENLDVLPITLENCQFDWNPIIIPRWDDSRMFFKYSEISATIDSSVISGYGYPNFDGYNTDPWGNDRIGIGAFWVGEGNSYYVDLDKVENGEGTQVNPWGKNYFLNTILSFLEGCESQKLYDGDNVYLKGFTDITNLNEFLTKDKRIISTLDKSGKASLRTFSINFLPWELSTNGPWGFYDSTNRLFFNYIYEMNSGIIISDSTSGSGDSFLYDDNVGIFAHRIENCFIKGKRIGLRTLRRSYEISHPNISSEINNYYSCRYCSSATALTRVNGSTLVIDDLSDNSLSLDVREPTLFRFKDSVVYCDKQKVNFFDDNTKIRISAVSAYYDWVVTNSDSVNIFSGDSFSANPANTTFSNMQYGWDVSVDWPDENWVQSDFDYNILGDGITISGSDEW